MGKDAKTRRKSVRHVYEFGPGKVQIMTGGAATSKTGERIEVKGFALAVVSGVSAEYVHEATKSAWEKTRGRIKMADIASGPRKLPKDDQAIINHREEFMAAHKGSARSWPGAAAVDYGVDETTVSRRWNKIAKRLGITE